MAQNVKQRDAVAALLAGETVTEAASTAGVSRATLHRWLAEDDFRAQLAEAETAAWQALARGLAGAGQLAIFALRAALADDQPMAIRLRAVDMILARGPVLSDFASVLARLDRLEQQIADENKNSRPDVRIAL